MTDFITASEAKSLSENKLIIYNEINAIEKAVLIACDNKQYSAIISDTYMTNTQADLPTETATAVAKVVANRIQIAEAGEKYEINDILSKTFEDEQVLLCRVKNVDENGAITDIEITESPVFATLLPNPIELDNNTSHETIYPISENDVLTRDVSTIYIPKTIVDEYKTSEETVISEFRYYEEEETPLEETHKITVGVKDEISAIRYDDEILYLLDEELEEDFQISVFTEESYIKVEFLSVIEDSLYWKEVIVGNGAKFNFYYTISEIEVTNHGAGYKEIPNVEFSYGDAVAIAVLEDESVASIGIEYGGTDLSIIPEITISPKSDLPSYEYYKVFKGIETDFAKTHEMNEVLDYFKKKDYTISQIVNEETSKTFSWIISWR